MYKEEALDMLKKSGYKVTKPREWIVEALEGNTSHPSAMEIFDQLRKNDKSFSFATVYNTLDTLVKAGVVKQVTVDPQCSRYDPDMSSHGHFYCRKCGSVKDVFDVSLDMGSTSLQDEIEGYELNLFGVCRECSTEAN